MCIFLKRLRSFCSAIYFCISIQKRLFLPYIGYNLCFLIISLSSSSSSSSSSKCANSTDSFDSLSLSLSPSPYRLSLLTSSLNVWIELINVTFCWSVNIGVSICRSPLENVAYVSILTSPAVPSMTCIVCEMGVKWSYSCYFVQNSTQHLCAVPIFHLSNIFQKRRVVFIFFVFKWREVIVVSGFSFVFVAQIFILFFACSLIENFVWLECLFSFW